MLEKFIVESEKNANSLFNWSREVGSRALNIVTENIQDNILHPEKYIDHSAYSAKFNTPIGDRYVILTSSNNISVLLIEDPIITVDRNREIVETKVQGLNSSIFEIIDNCSYSINIVGMLSGDSVWRYDDESIKDLNDIAAFKGYNKIECPYLNTLFNVQNVVILNHKINQSTEYTNIVAIELNLSSVKIDEQNSIFKK
jgi:hypothetical protein